VVLDKSADKVLSIADAPRRVVKGGQAHLRYMKALRKEYPVSSLHSSG